MRLLLLAGLALSVLARAGFAQQEGKTMTDGRTAELFVSPEGDDARRGRAPAVDASAGEGPVATLERARDLVRQLLADGKAPGGVTIHVAAGDYVLTQGLELGEEDSGREDAPVVWSGADDGEARLRGGRVISEFAPVTDASVRERLAPDVRDKVVQADLRAHGAGEPAGLSRRGFGLGGVPAHTELFYRGRPMPLAQWPDVGEWTTITGFGEGADDHHGRTIGKLEGGFHYEGDRPKRWADTSDLWVHGYWAWDWANSYEKVDVIDVEERFIRTVEPHGLYGYREGGRVKFLNVLEELNRPGEYYVDRERGMLYFYPPGPIEPGDVLVSELGEAMIHVDGASHVTFRDLTFEAGRHVGIRIEGGENVKVEGCVLRNLGTHAIDVRGGKRHAVVGCDIRDVGDAGILLRGGDTRTLEPCGHQAVNNHVYRFARWSRCYQPAISMQGVGIVARHNLIHDAPHAGILFGGNDHRIELNEIHRVTLETGDCGAIYAGRSWVQRGTVIRHNYIHHTGGYEMGSMGVYLDDQLSGITITGNVFQRVTRAAFIGGGRDNEVVNNVFIDCEPAVHVDGRGAVTGLWARQTQKLKRQVREMDDPQRALYRQRYPELKSLDPHLDTDGPMPPHNNTIERNVSVGGQWINIGWGTTPQQVPVGENLVNVDPHFRDRRGGDFRLAEDSPAWKMGFEPIPFEKIGLIRGFGRDELAAVRLVTKVATPPALEDGTGRIHLDIRNVGDRPAEGTVLLETDPADTAVNPEQVPFRLPAGESQATEIIVRSERSSFRIEGFSRDCMAVRPASLRVRRGPWEMERLEAMSEPAEVGDALSDAVVRTVLWNGEPVARVRAGVTPEALVIRAHVYDPKPARPEEHWKGSCFEVLAADRPGGEVGQVVFLPPAGEHERVARAYREGELRGESKARWRVRQAEGGYVLEALVPFAELGVSEPSRFVVEIAVGLPPADGESLRYVTLGGATDAFERSAEFTDVVAK